MIEFLKPFKEATGSKAPTLFLVKPWSVALENHLQPNDTDSDLIGEMRKACLAYFVDKFKVDILHDVAFFLHPSFKNLKDYPETRKNEIYTKVKELLKKVQQKQQDQPIRPIDNSSQPNPIQRSPKRKRSSVDLVDMFGAQPYDGNNNCNIELERYIISGPTNLGDGSEFHLLA